MRYILYAAIVAAILTAGCNDASAIQYDFESVNDKMDIHATMVMDWIRALPHEEAQEDEIVGYEECPEPVYYGYESDWFMQQGIRAGVDSSTETWYSSNRAYHEDTAQWSTDEEGYYRTGEGYYVVSSNDYEYGAIIETSKGQAQVLDDGTCSGNVDFYVAW